MHENPVSQPPDLFNIYYLLFASVSISDDDRKLFRGEAGNVRRLRSGRVERRPKPAPPEPRQTRRDEARVLEELASGPTPLHDDLETGEELLWLRPGLQRRVLTRLRRGHYSVGDELDLHQMNAEAAGASIRWFLDQANASGISCVKIIHGKGLRSGPGGPKLKRVTARILSRHPRVLAFAGARPNDGGSGAVYVLLRH